MKWVRNLVAQEKLQSYGFVKRNVQIYQKLLKVNFFQGEYSQYQGFKVCASLDWEAKKLEEFDGTIKHSKITEPKN